MTNRIKVNCFTHAKPAAIIIDWYKSWKIFDRYHHCLPVITYFVVVTYIWPSITNSQLTRVLKEQRIRTKIMISPMWFRYFC